MDGVSRYIEMWDGLIIEINTDIESVRKYTNGSNNEKIEIVYKSRLLPQYYNFGADKELRDEKYGRIKDILEKIGF
jgi:hypothetical protein